MDQRIRNLDDATAIRVLRSFAQAEIHRGELTTELQPELRRALEEQFGAEQAAAGEGDLARAALLLIAQDPQYRPALEALIAGPQPTRMGPVTTIALVTAALIALQTHVRFERDQQGRIRLKIEHKPMSDRLLKDVIQKLFGYLGASR